MPLQQTITIPFVIYTGLIFLVNGIFGNLFNLIIFYKMDIKNPSTYLLFVSSFCSLIYLLDGLLTRVLAVVFVIDPTRTNLIWCKFRTYIGQACSLISLTFICYAWIDQYFLTHSEVIRRRLSNSKRTKLISFVIIILWFIYALPFSILAQHVPSGNQTFICNVYANIYFNKYFSFFHQPFIASVIPILFILIVGILIHRNITLLKLNQHRQRIRRNLISMIFVQTICIIIQTIPYGFVSMYLAITLNEKKSSHRTDIESVILNISSIFYYFSHSFSFLIYYTSSAVYRQQTKLLISKIFCRNRNRIHTIDHVEGRN